MALTGLGGTGVIAELGMTRRRFEPHAEIVTTRHRRERAGVSVPSTVQNALPSWDARITGDPSAYSTPRSCAEREARREHVYHLTARSRLFGKPTMSRPAFRAGATGNGMLNSSTRNLSSSTTPSSRFMAGDPMKPATNVLAGAA
jgi:hypothetical protein